VIEFDAVVSTDDLFYFHLDKHTLYTLHVTQIRDGNNLLLLYFRVPLIDRKSVRLFVLPERKE
jgi:hypothetical protein